MIPIDFPVDGAGRQHPFPSRLPGTDDHRGPRHQAQRLFDEAVSTLTAAGPATHDLDPASKNAAEMVISRLANIRQHVYAGAADLDKLADNDMIPDRARERMTTERRQQVSQAVEAASNESELALKLLTGALVEAAQPRMPDGADPAEARELFRAVLDAAGDPSQAYADMLTGDDAPLAAVAASSFGQTYATRVRKVEPAVVKAYREQAALSVPNSGDQARRSASEHLRSTVPALARARTLVVQGAAMAGVS